MLDETLFNENPLIFLESNFIIVPGTVDTEIRKVGGNVHYFNLVGGTGPRNARRLNWVSSAPTGARTPRGMIRAYYLPWAPGECRTMTLKNDADFFFTSHFTNCRFTILTGRNGHAREPMVAHTAGDVGSGWDGYDNRDDWENRKGVVPGKDLPEKRIFDIREGLPVARNIKIKNKLTGENIERKQRAALHPYQGGDSSSAFIFGHRVAEFWHFHAQVAEGDLSNDDKLKINPQLNVMAWRGQSIRRLIDIKSMPART